MKKALAILLFSILALASFGKPASTRWGGNRQTRTNGIYYVCPHCGQTWGNVPPNLKVWEARHIRIERSKFIALHMSLRHGNKPMPKSKKTTKRNH